ncbi:MAG: 50S ribosomal protein L2 [Candidatus Rehaiarchaeum fermentans]|nr:50S ribosomal protein L2 [Candidatus Rehaiarchaeum fermentans]
MKVPRVRRRGKSRIFQANKIGAIGKINMPKSSTPLNGKIKDIIHNHYFTAPLIEVIYENGEKFLMPAFEGAYVGQIVQYLSKEAKDGNIMKLRDIPLSSHIYNIETIPNDGGKLVRAGGSFAILLEKSDSEAIVQLPSGKIKKINLECKAIIGNVANGGRVDKPFYKAGNKYYAMKAKGRYWPITAAVAMNAYEHRMGGKRRSTQHAKKVSAKNSPPGAKVGTIGPKKTGR